MPSSGYARFSMTRFLCARPGGWPRLLSPTIFPWRSRLRCHLLNTSLNESGSVCSRLIPKNLQVSVHDYDEAILVPKLMQQLAALAPGVSIECYAVQRKDLERELSSGSLDFALDVPLFSTPQLCRQRLATERYVCMLRPDHPVAAQQLTLERYLELEHIHVSGRRKGMGHVDIALEMMGRTRNVEGCRMKNYMAGPQVVSTTDLALTLPRNLATMYPMKIFEMPFNVETLDQYLYWHKSADQDQASIWMRTLLLGLLPGP